MAEFDSSMDTMREEAAKRMMEMNRRANGPRPYGGYTPRNNHHPAPVSVPAPAPPPPPKKQKGLLDGFDLKSLLNGNSDQLLVILLILSLLGDDEDEDDDCPDNHMLLLALAYVLF